MTKLPTRTSLEKAIYCLRLTSFAMLTVAIASLGRAVCLYGTALNTIKVLVFCGGVIGLVVILPLVIFVKKTLSGPKIYQSANRINNEIITPCLLIALFGWMSCSTWKGGVWEDNIVWETGGRSHPVNTSQWVESQLRTNATQSGGCEGSALKGTNNVGVGPVLDTGL